VVKSFFCTASCASKVCINLKAKIPKLLLSLGKPRSVTRIFNKSRVQFSQEGIQMKSFLAGIGIGIGLGILFAPMSGEETRTNLKERANDLADQARDVVDQGREKVNRGFQAVRGGAERITGSERATGTEGAV
jgi:hypothetical protein